MKRCLFVFSILSFYSGVSQTYHLSSNNTADLTISDCFTYNPAAVGGGEGNTRLTDFNGTEINPSSGTEIFNIRPFEYIVTRASCRYIEGPRRGQFFDLPGSYSIIIPTTETSYYERTSGGALYFEVIPSNPIYEINCNTTINATSAVTASDILRWEYRIANNPEETVNNSQNQTSLSIDVENFDADLSTLNSIRFRYVLTGNVFSPWKTYSIIPCSIELREIDWVQTNDDPCNDIVSEGDITLNFKSNVASGFQMRYFIFQGDYIAFGDQPDLEEYPIANFPQVFDEVRFDPNEGNPLLPNGDGTFRGTYTGLDGGNTNPTPPVGEENQQNYYVIYQEVRYGPGDDVEVKSAELIPQNFTIRQPSKINLSITPANVTQPECSGDTGTITVLGEGGGYEPNPNAALQYGFSLNGGQIDWTNATATFSNLGPGNYIFYARTSDSCISSPSNEETISVPIALELSNKMSSLASNNTTTDAVISVEFEGGTPETTAPFYSFELSRENAPNVFDIVSVPPQDIILTANRIEYRNLGIGTYRIKIIDANDCELTTEALGDIEVTAAPLPTLGNPTYTAITCSGSSDGEFSIPVSYGTANDLATTISYRLLDSQNIQIATGNIDIDDDPNTNHEITINGLASGNYSLAIVASTGSFGDANTIVTSGIIIDPVDPIAINFTTSIITNASCNGLTDGSIQLSVSGSTEYQYALTNLPAETDWVDLPADNTIRNLEGRTYSIILRDKDNTTCQSIVYSNAFEISEPDALISIPTSIDASTNGGFEGSISLLITGGTPFGSLTNPYTISWEKRKDNISANFIDIDLTSPYLIEGLEAATYIATILDANGCTTDPSPVEITITEPGPLSIESLTGTATCNGLNTGTLTASVQGTGDIIFDFLEQPSGVIAYTITTADRTVMAPNLAEGTYGLRITEVSSTNTVTTPLVNYFTINELLPISAIATPTNLACNETNTGVITITGATGGSNIGFEYAIDDGFGFQTGNTFTGLAPRIYIVTVRDDLGCEFTTTTEIVQAGAPVLNDLTTVVTNASSATNLDGAIVLEFETDPTNYTYAWSGPGLTGITTKDLNLIGAGTYQVIVSAPGNCTLTRNFTVGVQSAFSIQSFTGTSTCFNQAIGSLTATIEATGLVTFNWILDDGTANGTLVASETTALRTLSTQGLDAGTYYLEIVNDNAQTLRSTNLVEIVELAEVSAVVTPIPTCVGEATGSITFTVPTGSPSNNYTYSIDNGVTFQASPIFENLAAATYTPRVSVFENPNCDYSAPGVTITNSPILFWDLPNSIITRTSGPGATDGAISAAFTGGTAPYTFLWNPNPTNSTIQNITGVGAGIYNLTITDASSCSISQDFEVTEVGPLSITNIVPTVVLCRGEANGSITTTVTGEGTINYVWTLANGNPVPVSNGVNGPNITGIAAGNYILTATDINSTVATASIAIGEPATALSISNITPNNISCFGGSDGSIAIAATGGSGGYTFSINGGAFQPSPINGLIANSYTIRVRDANDCEFTEPTPVLLTEPEELNLIINEQRPVTAASAADGAIFITAEGGSGNYTYNWTGPNGYTSTEEDILSLGAGDYSVTITDANFGINNDAGCRLISNTITIAEPGVLIATINQSVFLECSGDDFAEITANVQGGVLPYVYKWFQVTNGNDTALTEDTDIIANLSAGTYFLRVTDANSVTRDTNPVVITAPSQVVVTIDNTTNVLCVGQPTGSANITVTGGSPPYQYFWSNASTVANVTGLDAGEYTIEVEDANGCNAQNTITITAPDDAIQIADVTLTNVSAYQAVDGSISLNVNGGSAPYNYAWTRVSDNSNAGNQATISNLAADSYTVVVSDANGCTITETYEVTQPDIIDETIIQPSCTDESDGSISVLVNQGNGTFTYNWNTGSIENNITNLGAGNYSVTVTGLASGPQTRNYVLENPVPLEVNLGLDRVLCANQTLELDATVNDETANYSWTSDNGFTSTNPVVELSQTGNYTVTIQSQTGCTTQGTIFVDISTDEIDAEFAVSSQVFIGETIVAVDISFPLPDGIEWILPIGAEISTQDKDAVEFSFAEAGEYDITIITTRGDCIAQKTKKILVVAKDGLIQEEDDKSGQKLVEEFIVYPNPTSGRFTADINLTERGDVSVKVFSFSNNALMASQKERGETSYSIPFDISGMPSGVYAVLLETPYGTSLRKIVVR